MSDCIRGVLGQRISDTAYQLTVSAAPLTYYVRLEDGSIRKALAGNCAPIPDLPVELDFDEMGNLRIIGANPKMAQSLPTLEHRVAELERWRTEMQQRIKALSNMNGLQ